MSTMSHNGIHLLVVTIFTVILSCWCSIDQNTQAQEQLTRGAQSEGGSLLAFEAGEKRASGFMPARGRKSFESNIAMDEDKRTGGSGSSASAFYGARGKKLILYPFFDYAWKRAHMIPMRGRKDSSIGSLASDSFANVKAGAEFASSYYPEEGEWKRSLFYGSRGKKDPSMASPIVFPAAEVQARMVDGDATFSWPGSNRIEEDKRAGFYGSRG